GDALGDVGAAVAAGAGQVEGVEGDDGAGAAVRGLARRLDRDRVLAARQVADLVGDDLGGLVLLGVDVGGEGAVLGPVHEHTGRAVVGAGGGDDVDAGAGEGAGGAGAGGRRPGEGGAGGGGVLDLSPGALVGDRRVAVVDGRALLRGVAGVAEHDRCGEAGV